MDIRSNQPISEFDSRYQMGDAGVISEITADLINKKNRKFQVRRSKVKDVARGLAEIAFNIGETNDPENFAEDMTENIFSALKKVEENLQRGNKKH